MEDAKKFPIAEVIHALIGFSIMLFGRYLPCPSIVVESSERLLSLGCPVVDGGVLVSMTPLGITIITIFAGTIYLWAFVDTIWPCFLAVIVLGLSGFAPMGATMGQYMGHPMVVMIFFLLIFCAVLIKSGISEHLAHWFMTRDIVRGRPWVFTAVILFATYCIAFIDQTSACFLMWPALYSIFGEIGLKKGDKYVSIMIVYTMIMALLSFATDPVKGGAFYLITNLQSMAASTTGMTVPRLNVAVYLLFGFMISMVAIALLMLMMRFVYRIDMTPLKKIDPDMLKRNPLPPMTLNQKIIVGIFLTYALWLLLPGIIGTANPVGAFMSKNSLAGALAIVAAVCIIKVDKKPVANILVTNASYPWPVYFLIATAFLLGGAMTGKGTNFNLYMEYLLRSWFSDMSYLGFAVCVCLIGIIGTNFCNSVVLGLILTPVILSVCQAFSFAPGPIMASFIYIVLVAACTPAASPFAAMMFGNGEWISPKDVIKYSVVASAVVTVVVVTLGLTMSQLFF